LSAGIAAVPAEDRFFRWSRWIASLSAHRCSEIAGFTRLPFEPSNSPRSLTLYCATEDRPDFAVAGNRTVVFEGVLYNAEELAARFGVEDRADDYGAILLRAYERMGEDFLGELRRIFALVVWDGDRDTLIAARDRTGAHPCFYARADEELLIGTAVDTLLAHPRVSKQVNRAAFIDYIVDSWPSLRETFYASVNRVPPGSALRVQSAEETIYRYWNPRAVENASEWLDERAADGFEDLLVAAVDRFLKYGPTGIFLSGGLDSVSVAAITPTLPRARDFQGRWPSRWHFVILRLTKRSGSGRSRSNSGCGRSSWAFRMIRLERAFCGQRSI
jgi:Glutamine amidotransferase domain/Asparagine synthase